LEELSDSMAKKGKKGDKADSGGKEVQPTGIEDLDGILLGGVPVGSSVLISGASGTGKTTFCFEVLGRAAANGEAGLILLTSETPETAVSNMAPYEFFDPSMVDDGPLVVQDMNEVYKHLGIDHPDSGLSLEDGHKLLEAITEAVDTTGAKRVAIDSLTSVLATFDNEGRVRNFLKDMFRSLASKDVTLYLTSEILPDSIRYSSSGIEDALADGVILMSNIESRGDLLRSIQIIKMRGIEHSRSRYVMDLTEYGIIIVPVLKSYTKGGGE
jgi:circadian clock protein KaiC